MFEKEAISDRHLPTPAYTCYFTMLAQFDAESAVGPSSLTQPDPIHRLTDPIQLDP